MIIHQAGWATIYQAHAGTVDGVVLEIWEVAV